MMEFITLALSFPATVYGVVNSETGKAESMCGETVPIPCDSNATTASGQQFDPDVLAAAVPMPKNRIMRPVRICLYNPDTGKRAWAVINDKVNPRYQGVRGLDLTPKLYKALTGKPATSWSSLERIEVCK